MKIPGQVAASRGSFLKVLHVFRAGAASNRAGAASGGDAAGV